jgi:RNA polymerase sigma factor (sigma-70 family)
MGNLYIHNKTLEDPLTDEAILLAVKRHDEGAIREVYQASWPVILQMVKLNNGDEADAKDLYQDSILDFLEKVWQEDFVLTCKIKTFIYSICRKKWLYRLRGRRNFIDIEKYAEFEEPAEEALVEAPEIPDDEQMITAIDNLGEPCKSLLIGFYYEKLSMEQLANKLNYKNENVAKQQKLRCKDRLKNAFANLKLKR